MPWVMPTLEQLRATNRSNVQAQLRSGPMIPNSGLRVMADSNAGLAYLTLLYINWLALQLMPDTAETEWLDRFASIWLPLNGRKTATYASGTMLVSGITGTPIPAGSQLNGAFDVVTGAAITMATTTLTLIGAGPTDVAFVALTPGQTGLVNGAQLSFVIGISGATGAVTVDTITDGIEAETDDQLRVRVLDRIREPPMGGDASDYEQWALAQPGVTRAWCAPNEMGIGTVTVRFMMDELRASTNPATNGFPNPTDVANVQTALNLLRPVAIKDFFVEAPIPYPVNFTIKNLVDYSTATQEAIAVSVGSMLFTQASPSFSVNGFLQSATTIYAAWVSSAILAAEGVDSFDLVMTDQPMPANGYLAVLGTISYA